MELAFGILGWNDGHHQKLNCGSNGVVTVLCVNLGDDRFFGKEGRIGRIDLIVLAERRFDCFRLVLIDESKQWKTRFSGAAEFNSDNKFNSDNTN